MTGVQTCALPISNTAPSRRHVTTPPASRAPARGVVRGWNDDGETRSRGETTTRGGRKGDNMATGRQGPRQPHYDDQGCTTCLQPREQLLVGWIVGGTGRGRPMTRGGENRETAPAPPLRASACRVVRDCGGRNGEREDDTARGWEGNDERENDTRPTRHPQPLPRAIARGVERGAT